MKEILIISICIFSVSALIFIFLIADIIDAEKIPKKAIFTFIAMIISGLIAILSVTIFIS